MATVTKNKKLNISLWVAQTFIAIAFFVAGYMKVLTPITQLAAMWPWTGELSPIFVRILGVIDAAGGVGVLLPALTRIRPGLTVLAALGCVALQVFAMVFHSLRSEFAVLPVNIVFIVPSMFVFWGRWKLVQIEPR